MRYFVMFGLNLEISAQADSFVKNKGGQLMTSVTTPVFDRRNHSVRSTLKMSCKLILFV